MRESFRESYLNLDKIHRNTKIEVRLFDETFYITLEQLRRLFLDQLPGWDRHDFAKKTVENIVTN
jgi:hypothetical protein